MFSSRITKYNPKYRNSLGAYLKNDWTSISDIGKVFDGKKFTIEEYLSIENSYVQAVKICMDFLKLNSLYIRNLQKHRRLSRNYTPSLPSMNEMYNKAFKDLRISSLEVSDIVRLTLREDLSCKLENENMFVHFGYDYYMYIGSTKKLSALVIKKIEKLGLFVENFESPYLEDETEENSD